MRQTWLTVVATSKFLEALGNRFDQFRPFRFAENKECLKAPGACFEDKLRRKRQSLGPASRVGIVKIGDEPYDANNIFFGSP
jgi:hypothetical protein